eukprot:scaffold36208_cov78-Phaeocystis_antarctica.AAC.3
MSVSSRVSSARERLSLLAMPITGLEHCRAPQPLLPAALWTILVVPLVRTGAREEQVGDVIEDHGRQTE